MKLLFTVILFFGFLLSIIAQSTFNKRILINEGIFQPASLFIGGDDNIYVYSLRLNDGSYKLCSSTYDYSGILLDTLCINGDWGEYGVYSDLDGQSFNGQHIQAGFQNDDLGLTGAYYQVFSDIGEPLRFNAFLNPWWNGDSLDLSSQRMLPLDWVITQSGSVLLSYSGHANEDEYVDAGIICFNDDDQYLWHLEWVSPVWETIDAITVVNDNYYLATNIRNDQFVYNGEVFMTKVSAFGEILVVWEDPWSNNVTEVFEMITDNSCIVCVGSATESIEMPSDALITKLDSSMNVIWSTFIDNQNMDFRRKFEDITITTDGNYVVSGQHPIILEEEDPIHGDYLDDGWLAKFNSDTGELLWERFYRIIESTGKIHEIFDVKATSDGGVAFCGESIDLTDDFTPTNPAQQGWLVKTDEFGCLVPGCQFVGVEEEDTTTLEFFKFGPNPLTKNHSLNFYLLQDLSPNAQLELWSLEGKKLAAINPGYKGLTTIWELPQLSAGVYSLVLNDGGDVLQSEMLIIE